MEGIGEGEGRGGEGIDYGLLVLSMRRIVPETQAAERRTWNSKPSEETSVTKGEGEGVAVVDGVADVVAGLTVVSAGVLSVVQQTVMVGR